jgi:acyl dehydratase
MQFTTDFNNLHVGQKLPSIVTPPLSRHTLALYCGASGDHNPIHVDTDFAKSAGLPDVFAHGMLSMAWLAHVLTQWAPQTALRQFGVRFAAITQVGETIHCHGTIVEKFEHRNELCVRIELRTENQRGEVKLTGEAIIAATNASVNTQANKESNK